MPHNFSPSVVSEMETSFNDALVAILFFVSLVSSWLFFFLDDLFNESTSLLLPCVLCSSIECVSASFAIDE